MKNQKRPSYFHKNVPDSNFFLCKNYFFLCFKSAPGSKSDGGAFILDRSLSFTIQGGALKTELDDKINQIKQSNAQIFENLSIKCSRSKRKVDALQNV